MAVAWPKKFKTHNLPRLIWAAKSSRGANFFHPSHFPRYTSFTAPQLRKNGRGLAKNSQNTQFATFNLGCKKFARREIFSSPAIFHVRRLLRRPNHAKLTVAWPKTVKTHNLPRLISAAKNSRGANFFHPRHFPRYTSFTASQPRKNGRRLAKKIQNTQFATFNFGFKKFTRLKLFFLFFIPAIFHVTRLLRRPNHAKMAVAWPKKFKTHNLPRLIWAAKSSRGANFFHPSHFLCYTSLTASQSRKMAVAWPKSVKTHNLPRLIWAAKSSRGANFFSSQPFSTLHVFYGVPTTQKWPSLGQKNSKHTICHV